MTRVKANPMQAKAKPGAGRTLGPRRHSKTGETIAIPGTAALRLAAADPEFLKGMTKLAETYAAAVRRSKRSGQVVRFGFDVNGGALAEVGANRDTEDDAEVPIEDALAEARVRGVARVAEILARSGMLSADAFAVALGTTRATVNTKRQNRQVLGLEGAKRGFRFPDWQIGWDGKPFAELPALHALLGDSPWAVYRFLIQHHPELEDRTGLEALQQGKGADVIATAETAARDFS